MYRFLTITLIAAGLTVMAAFPAIAVNPDEVLADPVLEQRARDLSVEIRCLVCQNQSIDDSDAQLAHDLRMLVREKLREGLSDQQILEFLVARYGEFILLKPLFTMRNQVLWIAPFVFLILGGGALYLFSQRGRRLNVEVLSEAEHQMLSQILKDRAETNDNQK